MIREPCRACGYPAHGLLCERCAALAAQPSVVETAEGSLREPGRKGLVHRWLDRWLLGQRIAELDDEERGCAIADDHGSMYLVRVYVVRLWRKRLPALFIHRFFRSDHDRELHNHPWKWALALVLTGGYVEERQEGREALTRRRIGPLSLNLIRDTTFHRVQMLDEEAGAWTLFLAGPRRTSWGFRDPDTLEYEDHLDREQRLREARRRA